MITNFIIASNPFFEAYTESDLLGKLIFIGLVSLSIITWILVIYKVREVYLAKKRSDEFHSAFKIQKAAPLSLEEAHSSPFTDLYQILKKQTIDLLNKNRSFGANKENSYLSPSDIDYVHAHLFSGVANQSQRLHKNLFILATIVSLAPFLGLLGTVWGILTTFSEMQTQTSGSTHQMVLGGLSLALATTVLGLIDAIPALIGYNYLKNTIQDFETDMEGFANEILASVEMQYRKVDIS